MKEYFTEKQKLALALQILLSIDLTAGLTPEARQKLSAFLELTDSAGFSPETRAMSGSLSSIVGHAEDRPLAVTRRLISDALKGSDRP